MRCRREKQARRAIKQNRKSGSLFWLFFFMETTGELPFWLNIILFFLFSPPLTMDAQLRTLSVLNLGLLSCFFFFPIDCCTVSFCVCLQRKLCMYLSLFIWGSMTDWMKTDGSLFFCCSYWMACARIGVDPKLFFCEEIVIINPLGGSYSNILSYTFSINCFTLCLRVFSHLGTFYFCIS